VNELEFERLWGRAMLDYGESTTARRIERDGPSTSYSSSQSLPSGGCSGGSMTEANDCSTSLPLNGRAPVPDDMEAYLRGEEPYGGNGFC